MRGLLVGLLVAAVLGALLDLGVFGFQLYQYGRINQNSRETTCWAGVLDTAVAGHVTRATLELDARACAKLHQP